MWLQTFVDCGQETVPRDKSATVIAVNKPKAGYVKKSELKIALFKDQQMKIDSIVPPPYTGPTVDKYVVSGNNGAQLRTCVCILS